MPNWSMYNGLVVPESVTMAKKLEAAQQERTPRGRFFSSMNYTQGSTGYGYTKPADTMPFEMLRQARDKSLIDKIIINARVTQIKHIAKRVVVPGKQVGFRVVHENYADPNFKPTEDVIRRCKETELIIDNVNTEIHPGGFRDFAAVSVDQELTFDRKAMVITRDRTGSPIRYHLVDSTTIRPMLLVLHEHMQQNKISNQYQAIEDFYSQTKIDLSTAAFVQIVDGMPAASWTKDEMSIDITNPSVDINKWAYGAGSLLEQSIAATVTWLNAWDYNNGLFNQDSPESLLFMYGDYDPVGLGAFQRQIMDQTGSGDYQKIPVITADPEFKAELVKIRELPKDIQFAEMMRIIIQLKTAAYRAHPSIVNFSIDKGGSSGLSIGNNSEDEIMSHAHEEGFETICHSQASWLTKTIVRPRYDDLVMIYDVDPEDEARRLDFLNNQASVGLTINEWRRAQGLDGDLEYGDVPNNPNYIQAMQGGQSPKANEPVAEEDTDDDKVKDPQNEPEQQTKKSLSKSEKVLIIEILDGD